MNGIAPGPYEPLHDGLVTLEEIAAIMVGDVPTMTEADLAAILCAIMAEGDLPVTRIVEPIIRAELQRRRVLYPLPISAF